MYALLEFEMLHISLLMLYLLYFAFDVLSRFAAIQSEADETMCDLYVQLQTAKHVELLANALFGNVLKLVRFRFTKATSCCFDIFNIASSLSDF